MTTPGTLFTVSAPSGAGKTSLVNALAERQKGLFVSVSHTTRRQRPSEQDGVNYHFVSDDLFEEMSSRDAFLEQARVFGHRYGTSREWVEQQLAGGHDAILEIDWQGAEQVKSQMPSSISIFILPPSRAALRQRLLDRGQDDGEVITRRMEQAADDIRHYHQADFMVINDDFEQALGDLECIVQNQRLRVEKQERRWRSLLTELLS